MKGQSSIMKYIKHLLVSTALMLIFFCLPLSGIGLFAQDLDKDMKYFYAGFIQLPSLECEMTSQAILKKSNTAYFDKKIKLVIHNNQYYYDMGDMIYIANKDFILWVDKIDKRMVVGKTDVNELSKFKKQLAKQTDTMSFKTRGTVIYEGIIGSVKSYKVVNFDHPFIHEVKVTFDSKTSFLRKMEFIFKEDAGTGITSSFTEFTKINTTPTVNESIFSQAEYIVVKNKEISLTSSYKNYQLIIIDNSILNRIKN